MPFWENTPILIGSLPARHQIDYLTYLSRSFRHNVSFIRIITVNPEDSSDLSVRAQFK